MEQDLCVDCNIQLEIKDGVHCCPKCGYISDTVLLVSQDCGATRSSASRRDWARDIFEDLLEHRARSDNKNSPPTNILLETAGVLAELHESGRVASRGSDARNKLTAAIMMEKCIERGLLISKKSISRLMGLTSDGFASGTVALMGHKPDMFGHARVENIVQMYFRAVIEPTIAHSRAESPEFWAYVETRWLRFILDILDADKDGAHMRNQLQSRVVGIIWYIVEQLRLPISPRDVETRSGGIKKDTFTRAANAIKATESLRAVSVEYFGNM